MTSDPQALTPLAAWRAKVEAELSGADFDKALVTRLREGLALQPVYAEAGVDPGLPGVFPFVRGGRAGDAHWDRTQLYRPDETASIAEDLAHGTDGVWLAGDHDVARALDGLDLSTARVAVDHGGAALLDVLGDRPVRALILGERIEAVPALIARLEGGPRRDVRAVLVSAREAHQAGAHAVLELAAALSTAVAHLRALDAAGIDPERAAPHFAFAFATGRDVLVEIAKLRAARLCWAKILTACGVAAPPPMWIHAETSRRILTTRDPWVNMLRVTTATFAAAVGGADSIASLPYDDTFRVPEALGRRVARNTSIVLAEESHLGAVVDPAGGSYAIEALTQDLARAAWAELQAIEGGADLAARIAAARDGLRADVVRRKYAITGVSEYPDTDLVERGRSADGDAAPFEALRDRLDALPQRPAVFLATLGSLADHGPRESFARGYFGVAGFALVGTASTAALAIAELVARFTASGARIACVCGTDAAYEADALELARALVAAGAHRVLLAGRAGPREAALREAGVSDFIFLGSDVEATLARLVAEVSR